VGGPWLTTNLLFSWKGGVFGTRLCFTRQKNESGGWIFMQRGGQLKQHEWQTGWVAKVVWEAKRM
jgi:hypothetical protein